MRRCWRGLSGAALTRWTLSSCSCTLHKSPPHWRVSWISETRCGPNSHAFPINIRRQDITLVIRYVPCITYTWCSLTWKSLSAFTRQPTSFFREKITANFPRSWVDFGSSLSGLSSIRLKDVLRSCVEVLLSEYKTLKMQSWVKRKAYFF